MSDYTAPLMKKKSFLRASEGQILANYNWDEIIEGTGYVNLYGGGTYASGGVTLALSSDPFQTAYGSSGGVVYNCTRYSTRSTSFVKLGTLEFYSAPYNYPKILEGVMMAEIPIVMGQGAGNQSETAYIVINLYLIRNGNETLIATETSGECSQGATGSNSPPAFIPPLYFSVPVGIPKTKIKRNDLLKLEIELWGKVADSGYDGAFMINYDPLNRETIAINPSGTTAEKLEKSEGYTQLKIKLPYRIAI